MCCALCTFGITAEALGDTLGTWSSTAAAWHLVLARVGVSVLKSTHSHLRGFWWKATFTLGAAKVRPKAPVICDVQPFHFVVVVVVVRVEES